MLCLLFCIAFLLIRQQEKKKVLEQAVLEGWYQKRVAYKELKQVQKIEAVGTRGLKEDAIFNYRGKISINDEAYACEPTGDVSDLSLLFNMENLYELNLSKQNISDIYT